MTNDSEGLAGLMARIVQWPGAGLDLVELAGELIAEEARFNLWAYDMKSRSTDAEMWNIAALADHLYAECSSAWDSYRAADDKSAGLDRLRLTIHSVLDRLRASRNSDKVDFDDPTMPDELRGG